MRGLGSVRNIAVLGAGAWAGNKVADFVGGMIPKSANDTTNKIVDFGVRILVVGVVAKLALSALGHRKAG